MLEAQENQKLASIAQSGTDRSQYTLPKSTERRFSRAFFGAESHPTAPQRCGDIRISAATSKERLHGSAAKLRIVGLDA